MQGCLICQKMKCGAHSYGKLPAWSVSFPPWHEVHVDCIGPWMIELHSGCSYQFNALTSIDPATNLLEIAELPRKTAQACADAFESGWLAQYPRPMQCIHDQGPEFIGNELQQLLFKVGVKLVPTSTLVLLKQCTNPLWPLHCGMCTCQWYLYHSFDTKCF